MVIQISWSMSDSVQGNPAMSELGSYPGLRPAQEGYIHPHPPPTSSHPQAPGIRSLWFMPAWIWAQSSHRSYSENISLSYFILKYFILCWQHLHSIATLGRWEEGSGGCVESLSGYRLPSPSQSWPFIDGRFFQPLSLEPSASSSSGH